LVIVARIVVIGNAAGGKSTLARHLARRRALPLIEVDRLLWRQGWQLTPAADYARGYAEIVAQDRWVIVGLGRQHSIAERLARSTEIILIDMPLRMHFWLAAERQIAWARGLLDHAPAGPPTCRRRGSCSGRWRRSTEPGCRTFAACAWRRSCRAKQ
jgi:adenylate kinase family enzyme